VIGAAQSASCVITLSSLEVVVRTRFGYICSMNLSPGDINIIRAFFTDKPVKKAFIFGSYSRGEADTDSDLDILVELDYSQHIGMAFFGMQTELEQKLHRKIDLVSDNGVSPIIRPFIEKDKVLVYAK
jgi:predicted nucleotidyltransferase